MAKFVVTYTVQVTGELFIEAESEQDAIEQARFSGPTDYVSWDNIDAVQNPIIGPAHIASTEEIEFRAERITRNSRIRHPK